ncbi:DNA repair protein RecO [Christiangramia fulva]|uniref:DNA repair protein RecO n=1 Tax=Christiangramia fulva TaxID=2126553 RepID=A0A2R3Z3U2_9FLAO|nr:DNA repair protein RecO [Christiangramia fulva]AVR44943.1 DNA repair protein RecO [Christiangramia fulva]
MLVSTKAIVISALKYGEADLIVKLYTLSDGLRTYMLRGVLKSKKGKFKASMFQALTKLEIVANHRNTGKLEYLKEARVEGAYASLHTNPVKSAMVMFLSEMLKNTIKEEEANPELFGFLEKSFEFLDHTSKMANFHLFFLLKLTRYLGFYPENRNSDFPVFNLLEGVFQEIPTNDYCIEGANADLLKLFLNADFFSLQEIRLNQSRRNEFLNMLLLYYELHIESFRKPKSLAVLNEIF